MAREQLQEARENPIQVQTKSNVENLLDLDLGRTDETPTPSTPTSILDDLGSLSLSSASPPLAAPQVTSPSIPSQFASPTSPIASGNNNMDDLLGIFGQPGNTGFNGIPQQNGSQSQQNKQSNEDILGLF